MLDKQHRFACALISTSVSPKDKFLWKNSDACSNASAFLLPGNSQPADYAKSHNFRFQISRLFGDYPKSS